MVLLVTAIRLQELLIFTPTYYSAYLFPLRRKTALRGLLLHSTYSNGIQATPLVPTLFSLILSILLPPISSFVLYVGT